MLAEAIPARLTATTCEDVYSKDSQHAPAFTSESCCACLGSHIDNYMCASGPNVYFMMMCPIVMLNVYVRCRLSALGYLCVHHIIMSHSLSHCYDPSSDRASTWVVCMYVEVHITTTCVFMCCRTCFVPQLIVPNSVVVFVAAIAIQHHALR